MVLKLLSWNSDSNIQSNVKIKRTIILTSFFLRERKEAKKARRFKIYRNGSAS